MWVSILISEEVTVAEAVVAYPSFRISLMKFITVRAVLVPNSAIEATPIPANRLNKWERTNP
jgi:hypothetical protein